VTAILYGSAPRIAMSASDEWTEWHLTPDGWERGSEKTDVVGVENKEPPPDRVLTCRFHEYLGSVMGKPQRWHDTVWMCTDAGKVAELVIEHGTCPLRL